MKTILLFLAIAFIAGISQAEDLQHDRLAGSEWTCTVAGREVGTLTFNDGGALGVSWIGEGTWAPIANGVQVLGADLIYANQTFTGANQAGDQIILTPAPAGAELDVRRIETLDQIKIVNALDHKFSVSGTQTAFERSAAVTWDPRWGIYSKAFEKNSSVDFTVRHLSAEREVFFEVLHLAKPEDGSELYGYSFDSRKAKIKGSVELEANALQISSDSVYNDLGVRITPGSKPAGWIAWVRDGENIMGLAASTSSLVDHYENKPQELLAGVKKVAPR